MSLCGGRGVDAPPSASASRRGAHLFSARFSWLAGVLASALGLWVSFHYDLPTGPVVVCMFGVLLLGAYLMRRAVGQRATLAPRTAVG